jgi:hypothetical protein
MILGNGSWPIQESADTMQGEQQVDPLQQQQQQWLQQPSSPCLYRLLLLIVDTVLLCSNFVYNQAMRIPRFPLLTSLRKKAGMESNIQ